MATEVSETPLETSEILESKAEPPKVVTVASKEEGSVEGSKKSKENESVTIIKVTPPSSENTDTEPPALKKPALELRYNEFVKMVNDIGKDVKPAYTNSRSHVDRLKRNITTARGILRECLGELDRLSRQQEPSRSASPSPVIKLN
ncbi:PREDICTED: uncharacterized protein LOC109583191 [Amphimedon queenslandica]|uniref:Uncharacterized protein n=1 Tax=Amphimedon queenslandica TaxID=400682 RepID=A0A1X7UJ25_AMPQE|nr:PREDICTED: uncharacterized protein LOC109583191 [Amphimedon queenslandica]|eukprot:XP_019853994.1 PREDICTED: uncharacterized protein LOC109583191 [Amphimedon queenslandica]